MISKPRSNQPTDLPNRSSFTSLAAFSPSSRRFLSIIFDLSAAALSSALTVQPMAPNTGSWRTDHLHKQTKTLTNNTDGLSAPADAKINEQLLRPAQSSGGQKQLQSFYPRVKKKKERRKSMVLSCSSLRSKMRMMMTTHPNHLVHVETLSAISPRAEVRALSAQRAARPSVLPLLQSPSAPLAVVVVVSEAPTSLGQVAEIVQLKTGESATVA